MGREQTIMTAAIAPVDRPTLRPYVVDDQGDTYVVCAPGAAAVRAVIRDRRVIKERSGDGVTVTELAMTREAP